MTPLVGIRAMLDVAREQYNKPYAENTRETFRRQTMHQFVQAQLAQYNPDRPDRPVNSPRAVYQATLETQQLAMHFGTEQWPEALETFLASNTPLTERFGKARDMVMVPVVVQDGVEIRLSPGTHSELMKAIVEEFASRYAPGGRLVYAGDTGNKWGYFDEELLTQLGVVVDTHGKMPDVIIYDEIRHWLLLVEAVTSHGPVDGKRHDELSTLFATSTAGLVFVTAFPNRATMAKYLPEIAWETEVWVSEAPSHLIHFNGERFLGPY